MGAKENGLTLEGLARRLEAQAGRLKALESENERMRSENAELRNEVTALKGSDTLSNGTAQTTRSLAARREKERPSGVEGPVSRRALLGKAGAAVAAVAAGTLLAPREARADLFDEVVSNSFVIADTYVAALSYVEGGDGVRGYRTASGTGGVYGENPNGYGFFGTGKIAGVYGEGDDGVKGYSNRDGFSGVYGTHVGLKVGPGVTGDGKGDWPGVWGRSPNGTGAQGEGINGVVGIGTKDGFSGVYGRHDGSTVGPGVTGDGKGNWPGVWGRNPGADGVTGETEGSGKSGVYGRHNGSSGFGLAGDGKGANGAGVLGRNAAGYGGRFEGGRAQLFLKPAGSTGSPTTRAHTKGEIYMDSAGTLFVCTANGTPGTWRRFTTSAV